MCRLCYATRRIDDIPQLFCRCRKRLENRTRFIDKSTRFLRYVSLSAPKSGRISARTNELPYRSSATALAATSKRVAANLRFEATLQPESKQALSSRPQQPAPAAGQAAGSCGVHRRTSTQAAVTCRTTRPARPVLRRAAAAAGCSSRRGATARMPRLDATARCHGSLPASLPQ